jgi:hypothetical protein
MSQYVKAEIWIGGSVSQSNLVELAAAIRAEAVSLDWVKPPFEPGQADESLEAIAATLLDARNEKGHLRLCGETAPEGSFATLEAALQQLAIAYDRLSDPDSCDPTRWYERVKYRPGPDQLFRAACDADMKTFVREDTLREVVRELEAVQRRAQSLHLQAALRTVHETVGRTCQQLKTLSQLETSSLPRLEIVHDPAENR